MPLLDHFHPPLSRERHWEGFHHAWATFIAAHLNDELLPPEYFAESEISMGTRLEIDVATLERDTNGAADKSAATLVWAPTRPRISAKVSFARLAKCGVRVYENLDGPQLRAAIEIVSPANKDRRTHRQDFGVKCASYVENGVHVVVVDTVTSRSANLHAAIFDALEVKSRRKTWQSATGLYAVAYRAVTLRDAPRVEVWPEALHLGEPLPTLPLWVASDLCLPLHLEETYLTTCRNLRIQS